MQSSDITGSSTQTGTRRRFNRFFSKKDRIVQRAEFVSMRDGSTKLYTKHLLILVKPLDSTKQDRSRLGVTITKKVDKRAVARNRFKRVIRELFRLNRFKLQQNFDIVVIARFGAHECSLSQLSREFLGALKKKGFLEKKTVKKTVEQADND